MTDSIARLQAAGVSVWLDDLSRERLTTGSLAALRDRGVSGVTTNPTIFARAISDSDAYQDQTRDLKLRQAPVDQALRELTASDVRQACDVLRPVYEATGGVDGRVSIEVDPRIAHDTERTVAEARSLWWLVDRPPGAAAVTLPHYEISSRVATRKAYGDALVALGVRPEMVALDGEVGNSTYTGEFATAYPDRFFEMFIAALRAVHGSTVLYSADGTAAAALTAEMADRPGIVYLRTTRGAWPVLYQAGEAFPAGGSKILRAGRGDEVTLIGAGVTVHQCLRAADELASDGIAARIIDLYSVKPVDRATLAAAATATGGRLVIAEDHYPQGGLGAAVLEALGGTGLPLRARQCAVSGLPGSGTPDELMEAAGISASRIAAAARELLKD